MNNHQFQLPGSYKKWTYALIGIGVIALLYGVIAFHPFAQATPGEGGTHTFTIESTRFWASLLQNSVYWLLVVNAAMFFICVTTMAMGGWQVALRRVPEAISSVVPILGIIAFVVLLAIVFGGRTDIYPWLDKAAVAKDHILNGKKGFLNAGFFTVAAVITILGWSLLGRKMRAM